MLSIFGLLMVVGVLTGFTAWNEAHADPVVTRYDLKVSGLGAGRSVRIAFLSDTHVNQVATRSSVDLVRLSKTVSQIDALSPDVVLLGGDYIATAHGRGDVPLRRAVAPFSGLKARYGVYSVVGNHDCQELENTTDTMRDDLRAAGTRPLVNDFADAGPVVVAGLDDLWCGRPDMDAVRRAVASSAGRPVILVSHNPDVFPSVPSSVALTVAGHTHAGQIVPPLIGPIVSVSRYGHRFRYGHVVEKGHSLVVSSGLGGLPLRWNARPEIVLITLLPR